MQLDWKCKSSRPLPGAPPGAGSETTAARFTASLPVVVNCCEFFQLPDKEAIWLKNTHRREEKRIDTTQSRPADCL